jgi:hypothetical protein
MQLEAFARLEERTGNPAGREPEQPAGFGKGIFNERADFFGDRLEIFDGFHAHGSERVKVDYLVLNAAAVSLPPDSK